MLTTGDRITLTTPSGTSTVRVCRACSAGMVGGYLPPMLDRDGEEYCRVTRDTTGGPCEHPQHRDVLRIGDRVLCLDARDGANFLVVGRTYTVDSVRESDGWVSVESFAKMWEPERFRLVREAAGERVS